MGSPRLCVGQAVAWNLDGLHGSRGTRGSRSTISLDHTGFTDGGLLPAEGRGGSRGPRPVVTHTRRLLPPTPDLASWDSTGAVLTQRGPCRGLDVLTSSHLGGRGATSRLSRGSREHKPGPPRGRTVPGAWTPARPARPCSAGSFSTSFPGLELTGLGGLISDVSHHGARPPLALCPQESPRPWLCPHLQSRGCWKGRLGRQESEEDVSCRRGHFADSRGVWPEVTPGQRDAWLGARLSTDRPPGRTPSAEPCCLAGWLSTPMS